MASTGCKSLAGLLMASALVLGGCTSADTTAPGTTNSAITVGSQEPSADPTSPATSSATTEQPTSSSTPAATPLGGPGDHEVGFGITLTLPEGWQLSTRSIDDDEQFHGLTQVKTTGQVALVTTDDLDGSPAEECTDMQDELADGYEDQGKVTRTQGTAHSDNAHTCGLAATDKNGQQIEITIFVAKGAKASFITASIFPTTAPEGVTQEELDQAVREASMMSSELLNDID